MNTTIGTVTGQQLLLMRVLGGPRAQARIEKELDHRALSGPPARRQRRPGPYPVAVRPDVMVA